MLGIRLQMRLEAVEEGIGLPALVMQARSCRNPRSAILALAVHNTPHGSSAKGGCKLPSLFSKPRGRGMKIATFNINNVNKRLANLLDWLRTARPDVACLQELKATDSEFPVAAIGKAGYGAIWRGQKSWNGVAILVVNALVTRIARDDSSAYRGDACVRAQFRATPLLVLTILRR